LYLALPHTHIITEILYLYYGKTRTRESLLAKIYQYKTLFKLHISILKYTHP